MHQSARLPPGCTSPIGPGGEALLMGRPVGAPGALKPVREAALAMRGNGDGALDRRRSPVWRPAAGGVGPLVLLADGRDFCRWPPLPSPPVSNAAHWATSAGPRSCKRGGT